MNKPPVADQAARDYALTCRGENLWIEAGAGTGKTTLLVGRILGLLTDEARPTPLARIAAITFTEKAAGELKVKLREKIEEKLAADKEHAESLQQALRDLETAAIGTLHSFARALLTERPLEAGIDPRAEMLDGEANERLLTEVYDQWFDEQVAAPPPIFRWYLAQKEYYQRRDDHDWLWKLARAVCANADILLERPAQREFDAEKEFARLREQTEELAAHTQTNCRAQDDKGYQDAMSFVGIVRALSPENEKALAQLRAAPKLKSNTGKADNWQPGESDVNKQMRADLSGVAEDIKRLAHAPQVWELFELAQAFGRRFAAEKKKRGVLSFADLLTGAIALLREHKPVRDYFQRKWDFLLIDEFQDTDPLQVEIAYFLGEDGAHADRLEDIVLKPGKLAVVGDPKQSIYRFRRADIEVYENTKRSLLGDNQLRHITVNWRCVPEIIETVNRVFAPLMQFDEQLPASPAYEPLASGRASMHTGVTLLTGDRTTDSGGQARTWEYAAIAQWIARAIDERRETFDADAKTPRLLRYRDVALLVRSRSHFTEIEDALRRAGLPYRLEGGKVYYTRPEVTAIISALQAIEDPDDSLALAQLLTSDLVGFSDEALLLYVLGGENRTLSYAAMPPEALDGVPAALRALHEQRNRRGCLATVRALYALLDALPIARALPRGEVATANLHKVLETARAADRAQLTFGEFARELAAAMDEEREETDNEVAEEADDVVQVLTIHQAKGLAWPVVIVPDLAVEHKKGGGGPVHHFERLSQRLGLRLMKGVETEAFAEMSEREKLFERAERVRLLYVAMTRARDYLVLPLFGKVGETKQGHSKQKGFLEFLVEAKMIDDALTILDPLGASVETIDADTLPGGDLPLWELPQRVQDEAIDKATKAAIDEALAADAAPAGEAEDESSRRLLSPSRLDDELQFGSRADGRLLGTAFHLLLQRLDLFAPATWDDTLSGVAAQQALNDEQRVLLQRWLKNFSEMDVFAQLRPGKVWREAPFLWTDDNGDAYSGALDLLADTADGWLILDYKTHAVEAARIDELLSHFRRQGEIYRDAVRALTGDKRPVRMIFCFVDTGEDRAL
ncbi:MAG TPA: UvrD-helicase domain-containing protein [bacterium]|nr:UvrD-helicase domain-containing protein [bacterium]